MILHSIFSCLLVAGLSVALLSGYESVSPGHPRSFPIMEEISHLDDVTGRHALGDAHEDFLLSTAVARPVTLSDMDLVLDSPLSDAGLAAAYRLAERGEPVVADVSRALQQTRAPAQARLLAIILARIGSDEAVGHLRNAVATRTDPEMLRAMSRSFECLNSDAGITLLVSVLTDIHDPAIIRAALNNISRTAGPEDVRHLVDLYASQPHASVQRRQVLAALESVTASAAVPALGAAVRRTEYPEMSKAAARGLIRMGTTASVEMLRDVLLGMPAGKGTARGLRKELIDLFISVRVTAENAPLLAHMTVYPPSPEWMDSMHVLATRVQTLVVAVATPDS